MTIDTSREAVERRIAEFTSPSRTYMQAVEKSMGYADLARDLVPALLARAEAAEDKIENAVQAMAETQPSWEYRCHAIVSALGVDFGGPTPEGIPEEHTWYARNLKRANTERDSAVERASALKAERDAALAEVARLSTAIAAERNQPTRTFIRDRNGREIMLGDLVLHHNAGPNTKREYWNGEYEVRWEAPSFVLRHVGGGLASDMGFAFKHRPETLEVIPQPVGNGEPLAKHGSKT